MSPQIAFIRVTRVECDKFTFPLVYKMNRSLFSGDQTLLLIASGFADPFVTGIPTLPILLIYD
ncbi:hypothetical protein DP106_14660 [Halonotius pteroides]|uniref:Uncharacterized protein n=1 Tax=Halonotius pteroides TaxID=268735 RepID=A0A3A6Q3V9_9EURY|nr:hypothetical protein DP106_14660 [Halonotius pteroides]